MDPITAIGLAASVVQIVQFSIDTAKSCREIYQKGCTADVLEANRTAGTLDDLTGSLQESLNASTASSSTLSKNERELVLIAGQCQECARKLQHEVDELQMEPRSSILGGLAKVLRGKAKERDINKMQRQLENHQRLLETSLLHRLK